MTIDDIKKLIADDESRTLELKKSTGEIKDGMHSACAFLNSDGGWLIFGIAPGSNRIIGQEVSDRTRQEIATALSGIEPVYKAPVSYIDISSDSPNQVIAIFFQPLKWGDEPYTFHGCPYYKVENTTKRMPRELFEKLLYEAKPHFYAWENKAADGIDINDLNEDRIRGAIRLGIERGRVEASALTETFDSLLDKLNLLTDERKPNNAAAFLFGTNSRHYPQFQIQLARFVGNDKISFRDNIVTKGNFFDLLDAGMSFLFKHLSQSGEVVGLYRQEQLEIPQEALREALTNALAHRQWERYNGTIGIAIFDDRVEISNPGYLQPPLTPANITQSHKSFPYNPIIAETLFKSTFLERWGSGISRITEACNKADLPIPTWTSDGYSVTVTFKRPNTESNTEQVDDKHSKVTQQVTQQAAQQATQQVINLLKALNHSELSVKELMAILNLKDRPNFIFTYLNPAIEAGLVEPTFPEQPRHPKQRYRLTELGKNLTDSIP